MQASALDNSLSIHAVYESICDSVKVATIYLLRNLSPRSRVYGISRGILRLEVM